MKKLVLVLGMITCIFSAAACGSKQDATPARTDITEADAAAYGESMVDSMAALCADEQLAAQREQLSGDPVWASAISSWESAMTDMGSYEGILETTVTINEKDVIINVKIDGTSHDANVELLLEENEERLLAVTSMSTNVIYSFGEMMEKAALNTLLGMGTVFVVLILISVIISCFTFIPKIQAAFTKKEKEEVKPAAVDNTIAQIVEKEELSDDLELVAVIAAAVAASEGAASTDGFVVRSIRKRRTF